MVGIYKITSPSGKIYIGQSVDIRRRLKEYKKLKSYKQPKLHRSFLKYGFDSHIVEIVEKCLIEELNDRERYYQDLFDCLHSGLNCYPTQSTDKSGKHSEETKKKLSIANSNPSDEVRLRKSKGQMGRPFTEEMRRKVSIAHTGRKYSAERLKQMSETSKNPSAETRLKMSLAHIGHKHTDESKRKISEASKLRVMSDEAKLKIASKHGKRVINTVTGEIYLSMAKAAKAINHNEAWLGKKLNGFTKNNTNLILL